MNELKLIKTERGISYNQEVVVKLIESAIRDGRLSDVIVICPKLARKIPKDKKFWGEI